MDKFEKIIKPIEENEVVKPVSVISEKWYQQWWVGRLFGAFGGGFLGGIIFSRFTSLFFIDGFLISFSILLGIVFSFGNPQYRYYKAGILAFSAAVSNLLLNIEGILKFTGKTLGGNVQLSLEKVSEYDWLISLVLLILSGYLISLDYNKDKSLK